LTLDNQQRQFDMHYQQPTPQPPLTPCVLVSRSSIEIEGGYEIPVLDNSALGWTLNIQQVGGGWGCDGGVVSGAVMVGWGGGGVGRCGVVAWAG